MCTVLSSKAFKLARVNEVSHSFTCHPHIYPHMEWAMTAFTCQPQSITAFWPIIISHPTEVRRLSWCGWLDEILRWFVCLKTVTHPSSSRSGQESNSRPLTCESNGLTTRLLSHQCVKPMCVYRWGEHVMDQLADAVADCLDVKRSRDSGCSCQSVCVWWAGHQAADCVLSELLAKQMPGRCLSASGELSTLFCMSPMVFCPFHVCMSIYAS